MKHSKDVVFWSLFSSGGTVAALFFPALAGLLLVVIPAGWIEPPAHADLARRAGHPVARFALFAAIGLAAFHWAHRFRYTLYDGLQLYHLYGLIATICYGGAAVLTVAAAWVVWSLP